MKHLLAIIGLVASAAAMAAPQPESTASAPQASTDTGKPITPAAGKAVEAFGKVQAATQAHNSALMSRRNQCVELVRQGVIKPTATAQLNCILKGAPASK